MKMTANLHWPVATVGRHQRQLAPASIYLDVTVRSDHFTGLRSRRLLLGARANRLMHGHQFGTVGMVDALLGGGEPEINDTETYDNGVKVVPSYLLEPVSVDKSNYKEVLIDSGYYTEDQLK